GRGRVALGSGAFDGPYSLRSRVEEGVRATNPEELVGAAEAACFTMSLADLLGEAGYPARDLRTTARVTLAQAGASFNITRIDLRTVGDVPGVRAALFRDLGQEGHGLHGLARPDRHRDHARRERRRWLTRRGSRRPPGAGALQLTGRVTRHRARIPGRPAWLDTHLTSTAVKHSKRGVYP